MNRLTVPLAVAFAVLSAASAPARAFDIVGPPGSVSFGAQVAVLANGNIVVTDPRRPPGGFAFLYAPDGRLISQVGGVTGVASAGLMLDTVTIVALPRGDYLLVNPRWIEGAKSQVGMVAWASGTQGLSGTISQDNALLGSQADDRVGHAVEVLRNGHYLVRSMSWNDGARIDAGAVTWGDGRHGVSGRVSPANSIVGEHDYDGIGGLLQPLRNGNYVIGDVDGRNDAGAVVGAFRWVDGSRPATGTLTDANSLIGSTPEDGFFPKIRALANGHYVIALPWWDNGSAQDAGAAIWCDGTRGCVGQVSAANALVGTRTGNYVGHPDVEALPNGHYVVGSSDWEGEAGVDRGAVTWGNGFSGTRGAVTTDNSIVGTRDYTYLGDDPRFRHDGIVPLANGDYLVASPHFTDGKRPMLGAVTWARGTGPSTGTVDADNSLVGRNANDEVGSAGAAGIIALPNGNYVIATPQWHDDAGAAVGAVTWRPGRGAFPARVDADNSLVGRVAGDGEGLHLTALTNGNYVVTAATLDRDGVENAGAAAWADGRTGLVGTYSATNALLGSQHWEFAGAVFALADGNYVVCTRAHSEPGAPNTGALTWGDGRRGTAGEITPANSLLGVTRDDQLCGGGMEFGITALNDGGYIIASPDYDHGGVIDAGAYTLLTGRHVGSIDASNTVFGSVQQNGETGTSGMDFAYDAKRARLVVGRSGSNRVTVLQGARRGLPAKLRPPSAAPVRSLPSGGPASSPARDRSRVRAAR